MPADDARQTTIALERAIPKDLLVEVGEKLAYASEHLTSFRVAVDGSSIEIETSDPSHVATVIEKVKTLVTAMTKGHRKAPPETIFSHRAPPPYREPVWDTLLASGILASEGPGQIALLGPACRLADALDAAFTEIGTRAFAATPHQYPTMLALELLDRCEYFSSFPHHVTFAPHMREDLDAINDFGRAQRAGDTAAITRNLAPPRHALSPAVCFHTYGLLADKTLAEPQIVTAKGRCFRWESKNLTTLERCWDFSMREVIFVGPRAWVDEMRERSIEEVKKLVVSLGLDAWIETANDPFFATAFVTKRYHQLMTRAKYELRLGLPDAANEDRSLAAASFNVHGDFFGRSLGIKLPDGEAACTGCLAFGVERWVWALFSQLGPDTTTWPSAIKERLAIA